MFNPVHPGTLLREEVLKANGLTQAQVATRLRVTQANLNRVVTGKAALSIELALKVEKAFGISADLLVRMQAGYDLAQARGHVGDITAGVDRLSPVDA
jgi:antitoxin HigA-1